MNKSYVKNNRMKHKLFILFVLFSLFLSLFAGVFNVNVVGSMVVDDTTSSPSRIVMDSNNILHCVYKESNNTLYYENSGDFGVTWSNRTIVDNVVVNGFDMVVDSHDYLFVAIAESVTNKEYIKVFKSVDTGVTWSNTTVSAYDGSHQVSGDVAICVDNDDDVTVAYIYLDSQTGHWLYARTYTNDTDTWGANTYVGYGNLITEHVECMALSDDRVFIIYSEATGGDNTTNLYYNILNTDLTLAGKKTIYNGIIDAYDIKTFNAIVGLDYDIHIVYVRGNNSSPNYDGLYYVKYDIATDSLGTEEKIYYSLTGTYPVISCGISMTYEGDLCVLFSKHNVWSTTDKIHKCIKTWGGSWGTVYMFNIGNDNETEYPNMLYQNYPSVVFTQGFVFTFFNDTTNNICYATSNTHTWYDGVDYYPGDNPWGGSGGPGYGNHITLNVYNESNTSEDIIFNVFITNQSGSETYYDDICTTPYNVYFNQMPTGDNISFLIGAAGYYSRQFYFDIDPNTNYEINVYLAPYTANLYLLNVVGPFSEYGFSPPVENVKLTVKRYFEDVDSYQNISILYTDTNGQCEVYLLPDVLYKVILEKEDYITSTNDYIPSASVFTHTFRIYPNVSYTTPGVNPYDYINFTASFITNINLSIGVLDSSNHLDNATIYIYENKTLINTYNFTTTPLSYYYTHNTSRPNITRADYTIVLYVRHHPDFGFYNFTIFIQRITSYSNGSLLLNVDLQLTGVLGNMGANMGATISWVSLLLLCLVMFALMSFGRYWAGVGIATVGLLVGLFELSFGLTVVAVGQILSFVAYCIVLGILMELGKAKLGHGGIN